MGEIRFRATGPSEDDGRGKRLDRRTAATRRMGWILVGGVLLYVLGGARPTGRVEITSPATGTSTLSAQIAVSGRVTDTQTDAVTLNVNGSSQTVPANGGVFEAQIALAFGDNTVVASANAVSSESITITRPQPVVMIRNPAGATSIGRSEIEVLGSVENSDERAVTIDVNGAAQVVALTDGRFSAIVRLAVGSNVIRAFVAGAASEAVEVVRLGAHVTITAPTSGYTTAGEVVTVVGTVENSDADAISLDVNGSRQMVPVRDGGFVSDVRLTPGDNRIIASVGDVTSEAIVIHRAPPPVIITITSPQSGPTSDSVALVRGVVQNPRRGTITLTVNGSPREVAVERRAFAARAPLEIGANVIQASQDTAVSNEVVVDRLAPPTVIEIISPKSGETRNSSARVTGKVTNPSGRTITLTVNRGVLTLGVTNGGFSSDVQLEIGENRIRALQGAATSNEVVVNRLAPLTLIEITSPQSGETTDPSVRVIGKVVNPGEPTVTLRVNRAVRTLTITNGGFSSDVRLQIGDNHIRASQGQAVSNEVVIRRRPVDVPPAPIIVISSPKDGFRTRFRSIVITGEIQNADPAEITLEVNTQKIAVPVSQRGFKQNVILSPGRNLIRALLGVVVVSNQITVTLDAGNDSDRTGGQQNECARINCDCGNLRASHSLMDNWRTAIESSAFRAIPQTPQPRQTKREQCQAAEERLIRGCKESGTVTGTCPADASGPNAWPPARKRRTFSQDLPNIQGVKKP
ncbi:MAG TPA: hypothetical protein VJH03_05710 [Blastocatellia bacterium]|nr:hypothetical protein [Blastocatellia bacterium]